MKEKIILEKLLKFYQPYESFSIKENSPGVYTLENVISLDLPNLPFKDYSNRFVIINLNIMSIAYDLSNYSGTKKYADTVAWENHIGGIINQLIEKVKKQLDYDIRIEDAKRVAKSRECRVNRRVMSLIELT